MTCERCNHRIAGKPKEIHTGRRVGKVCNECANLRERLHSRTGERLLDIERDARRRNKERLAQLEAQTPARRARMAQVTRGAA